MTRTVLFAPETCNLAEVTRGIEVARRMPTGTRCVFAGFSDRYAEHVTRAGFDHRPLTPVLDDRDADALLALDQGRGWRNPLTWQVMAERVVSERALIRKVGASAVVIGTTLSQVVSARAERVPLVYVKPFAYSLPHVRAMRRTGLLDGRTPLSRALDAVLASVARTVGPRVRVLPPGWSDVARAHGVDLRGPTLRLLEADLNLVTTAPQLLPVGLVLPESYRVVGPVFARMPGEVPQEVLTLRGTGRPVVYVAVGSSGQRPLVLQLLQALGPAPVGVLAPVRHLLTAEDLGSLPDNVLVTGWLPAHRLGHLVDLAITHGGEGTLQNSMVQGWPTIGIPLQLEQRFNLLRLVEEGTARLVERGRVSGTDWPALVAQVVADDRMRTHAQALAQATRRIDGAVEAARLITRLLDGPPLSLQLMLWWVVRLLS